MEGSACKVKSGLRILPELIEPYGRYLKWGILTLGMSVGGMVFAPFGYYFAADLEYGFLRDKRDFFFSSGYFVAFYAHIVGAPVAFISGTLQVSRTLRQHWPRLHRWLGRFYCVSVLVAAAPGGLVMGFWAYGDCRLFCVSRCWRDWHGLPHSWGGGLDGLEKSSGMPSGWCAAMCCLHQLSASGCCIQC